MSLTSYQATPGFVGGCPTTQLFPGVSASTTVTASAAKLAQCGEMATWIIGANWWLNHHVRLTIDYTQSNLSDYPITTVPTSKAPAVTVPPGGTQVAGFDGATIRAVGMRAQIDW